MNDSNTDITGLAARVEQQLDNFTAGDDPPDFEAMISELRQSIQEAPEAGPKLGPLLGKVRKAKEAVSGASFKWVKVLDGAIAIGHRPKVKTMENMAFLGVTHVLTLLSESEGARKIGHTVRRAGLEWIWLPLPSADPPGPERTREIVETFREWETALQERGAVYVHCSAGIHRTGMITYGFLRYLGHNEQEARQLLADMRSETIHGVGNHRLQWGNSLAGTA